jgi:hypothetical protein
MSQYFYLDIVRYVVYLAEYKGKEINVDAVASLFIRFFNS